MACTSLRLPIPSSICSRSSLASIRFYPTQLRVLHQHCSVSVYYSGESSRLDNFVKDFWIVSKFYQPASRGRPCVFLVDVIRWSSRISLLNSQVVSEHVCVVWAFRESERCGLTWPVVFGCNPPLSMLDVVHSNQPSNKGVAGSDELWILEEYGVFIF
jgi:hypothetical protein